MIPFGLIIRLVLNSTTLVGAKWVFWIGGENSTKFISPVPTALVEFAVECKLVMGPLKPGRPMNCLIITLAKHYNTLLENGIVRPARA